MAMRLAIALAFVLLGAIPCAGFSTPTRFETARNSNGFALNTMSPLGYHPSPFERRNKSLLIKHRRSRTLPLYSSSDEPSEEEEKSSDNEAKIEPSSSSSSSSKDTKLTLWGRIRKRFVPEDDGLTTKQRLAKMGLSAILSYGWISNVSYAIGMSLSWFAFSKKTGLSPLAKDQWKPYLAVYAGFWVFNNVIRPLRVAAAVAITPAFDRMVESIQTKTNFSRAISIALIVFLFNVVGTIGLLASGVTLASIASGVPIFPGKA